MNDKLRKIKTELEELANQEFSKEYPNESMLDYLESAIKSLRNAIIRNRAK